MTAPPTVNLTAAARRVVAMRDEPVYTPEEFWAAREVWENLTGLSGAAALAYARELTVGGPTQRAALIPF